MPVVLLFAALAATAAVAAVLAVARARAVSAYREVRDMLHAERGRNVHLAEYAEREGELYRREARNRHYLAREEWRWADVHHVCVRHLDWNHPVILAVEARLHEVAKHATDAERTARYTSGDGEGSNGHAEGGE